MQDRGGQTVVRPPKTRVERTLALDHGLVAARRAFRRERAGEPVGFLSINQRGGPLSPDYLQPVGRGGGLPPIRRSRRRCSGTPALNCQSCDISTSSQILTGSESNYLIDLVPRRKLVVLLAGFLFVVGGGAAAVVIGTTGRESLTGNRPAAGPVGSTSAPQPTPTIVTPPPTAAPATSVVAIPVKSPVAPPASAKAHTDTAAGDSDPNDRMIRDRVNEPPINSRPQAPSFPIYTTHSVSTPTPIPNPAETAPPYSR
ncbi:hypothetical protein SAMN04489732_11280 [Amycolatopsis saalfeldensis]|uniref:Uncharacterized protein n=1 Tax=Amycolatopsis saalfeldensis TaxID=394193 RepID=A0A1H8Y8H6_9PSEU|nr:hypothetical protein SAMN04489732_11280 [Amycolatopsis saalfeldensis]